MGKFLDEMENVLDELDVTTDEVGTEEGAGGWEIEPDEAAKYEVEGEEIIPDSVTFDGAKVCNVQFYNNDKDKNDSFEEAQEQPEAYTVFVMNVVDKAKGDEFVKLVRDAGFKQVSVEKEHTSKAGAEFRSHRGEK